MQQCFTQQNKERPDVEEEAHDDHHYVDGDDDDQIAVVN